MKSNHKSNLFRSVTPPPSSENAELNQLTKDTLSCLEIHNRVVEQLHKIEHCLQDTSLPEYERDSLESLKEKITSTLKEKHSEELLHAKMNEIYELMKRIYPNQEIHPPESPSFLNQLKK